ncbi:hypothetical protein EV378_5509 [Pseudonocardia endophytica]|uniref:Uncharacterized protein n=1 Tax=Pseudonocardia endophytica TaxID=401976 RepID=A0A4R1HKF0_PSEEN|nr:hypothetical protein EV378_5509 [Pseudonocardia endophytica]
MVARRGRRAACRSVCSPFRSPRRRRRPAPRPPPVYGTSGSGRGWTGVRRLCGRRGSWRPASPRPGVPSPVRRPARRLPCTRRLPCARRPPRGPRHGVPRLAASERQRARQPRRARCRAHGPSTPPARRRWTSVRSCPTSHSSLLRRGRVARCRCPAPRPAIRSPVRRGAVPAYRSDPVHCRAASRPPSSRGDAASPSGRWATPRREWTRSPVDRMVCPRVSRRPEPDRTGHDVIDARQRRRRRQGPGQAAFPGRPSASVDRRRRLIRTVLSRLLRAGHRSRDG